MCHRPGRPAAGCKLHFAEDGLPAAAISCDEGSDRGSKALRNAHSLSLADKPWAQPRQGTSSMESARAWPEHGQRPRLGPTVMAWRRVASRIVRRWKRVHEGNEVK